MAYKILFIAYRIRRENQNEKMVKFIISCDAENNTLRKDQNYKGLKPFDLDPKRILSPFYSLSIWDLCQSTEKGAKERIIELVSLGKYTYTEVTPLFQNSLIHFAVLSFNYN